MHRHNNLISGVRSREITTSYRFALNTTVSTVATELIITQCFRL